MRTFAVLTKGFKNVLHKDYSRKPWIIKVSFFPSVWQSAMRRNYIYTSKYISEAQETCFFLISIGPAMGQTSIPVHCEDINVIAGSAADRTERAAIRSQTLLHNHYRKPSLELEERRRCHLGAYIVEEEQRPG